MSMHSTNAFWAAQEPLHFVAELFMPADTPTGAMTYVMVNKRKNTLSNRHKRQLQRLCDFQSKELHDHRQAFCTRYKDQKRVAGTLSSEIGMFQVISGSKWLRENYESIFKPASAEDQSEDVGMEKSLDSESRVFHELMDRLDSEQDVMRIRQATEYEAYRLFQLRELQMLNQEITTRAGDQSQTPSNPGSSQTATAAPAPPSPPPPPPPPPTSTPTQIANRSHVPPFDVESPANHEKHGTVERAVPQVISAPATKKPSTKIPYEQPPNPRPHGNTRDNHSSNPSLRRIPPPPPPPPPPLSRSVEPSRSDQTPKQKQREQLPPRPESKPSHSIPSERVYQSHKVLGRKDRSMSIPERNNLLSPSARDQAERSPRSSPSVSDRSNRSSPSRIDKRYSRARRSRSPDHRIAPWKNHHIPPVGRSELANPEASTSRLASRSQSDNAPPMVESSKRRLSKDGQQGPAKKKKDEIPSVVCVDTISGNPKVVRRYQANKRPTLILGDPRQFDDAIHNPKAQDEIRRVTAEWRGEWTLCFTNSKRDVLGKVSEIEPVVRNFFIRGSSNSEL